MFKFLLPLVMILSGTAGANATGPLGTVVGNGGEPILYYLELSRTALMLTLEQYLQRIPLQEKFCKSRTAYTAEQLNFCVRYAGAIASQMKRLNSGSGKTPFVLRLEPLLVEGPDGKPMPVSARTELGPTGIIEFHLDSIKLLSPKDMLHLLFHEFQHKIEFEGKNISDNQHLGPFNYARDLIDLVASEFAELAIEVGQIGRKFNLKDYFSCVVETGGYPVLLDPVVPRVFYDDTLTRYATGLRHAPGETRVAVQERFATSIIAYQVIIEDRHHCQAPENLELRKTTLRLIRFFQDQNTAPQLVAEQVLPGFNPLCQKQLHPLEITFGQIKFTCTYMSTQADSNSALK